MYQNKQMRYFLATITLCAFVAGAVAEHIRFNEQFEKYKLIACEQKQNSYLEYRQHADNRIGLLENYLTTICYNAGYEQFTYDKKQLFTTHAKCINKFSANNLPDNLTLNNLYVEISNNIKNKVR